MLISLILVAAVVGIVGFGVALSVRGKQEFTKQNEVVPGQKSPAPASWAGAHTPEARLHRRLGDAVRAARANPRLDELGLTAQTRQVEIEALAIDERLVAAAALPASHRADAVAAFEPQVAALEDAVAALVTSTTVGDSKQLLEQSVSEADLKLQALAQARAEVEQLDRTASGTLPSTPIEQTMVEQPAVEPGSSEPEQGGATG